MVKVRRATEADKAVVVALMHEFYQQSHYAKAIEFSHKSTESLVTALLGEAGILQVAELDGKVVGFTAAIFMAFPFNAERHIVTELALYVQASARGHGAGKQLLKKLEQVSTQRGAALIVVASHKAVDTAAATAMYQSSGYTPNESSFVKEL